MHQQISYKDQFTPWNPNHCVDNTQSAGLDFLCLLIYHHSQREEFEKVMILDDKIVCSGVVNAYLNMFVFNSQRAYREEGGG